MTSCKKHIALNYDFKKEPKFCKSCGCIFNSNKVKSLLTNKIEVVLLKAK